MAVAVVFVVSRGVLRDRRGFGLDMAQRLGVEVGPREGAHLPPCHSECWKDIFGFGSGHSQLSMCAFETKMGGYVRGIWHRSDRICWIPFLTLSEVARTNSSEAEGYDLMLRLRPAEVVESQLLLGGSGKMGEAMTWLTAQRNMVLQHFIS